VPKRYLVTGGCGFIGTNLVRRLVSVAGAIRIFDNLTTGRKEDLDSFDAEIVPGDIRDEAAVDRVVNGVDVVIHLAAHTRVIDSIQDPRLNFEVNVLGTLNLLQAAVRQDVQKFIFASTGGAILGEQPSPVHEEMAPRPLSPYGASKLAGEGYCWAFYGAYGLVSVSLRFSNVYGPYSWQKGSVVTQFYRRILSNEPLVIYGDGRQTRDFLYVGDLCEAVLLACQYTGKAEVFHIASGQETEIAVLAEQIKAVAGRPEHPVRFEASRRGEVRQNYASIDKAKNILAYSPTTALEIGLKHTWNWFSDVYLHAPEK